MAEAIDELRGIARAWAPDFYLSALLAPRAARGHLLALAAFLGDVERIVATVVDPALAEIRLQWWRDAIAGAQKGQRTGHPVADALGEAIRARSLPFAEFDGLLDARALDLYADALPDESALAAYLNKADGAALRLGARCLGHTKPGGSLLIDSAARAIGMTRLIRTLPMFLARGRPPFPGADATSPGALPASIAAHMTQARLDLALARAAWRAGSLPERSACLPLAVVEGYLRAAERRGHDPARMLADVQPLTRVWRLWVAHVTGRI